LEIDVAITDLTSADLIRFEDRIAKRFNDAEIKAPVHLYNGNEDEMIRVFDAVKPGDWVMCSWRSHYQCLLKGVPESQIESQILAGGSISLCFPEYRILSSAIVGGVLPIAVGVALSLHRSGSRDRVFCFMGDMTSETGIAHECVKFSRNHGLPIHFVIEDNGKSVCTDTREVWGAEELTYEGVGDHMVTYFRYETKWPHAGAGVRVQF
jgi:TPP-dependent pyruvate/acetoin dehydrogenase alpha subunit